MAAMDLNTNDKLKIAFYNHGVDPEEYEQLGKEILDPVFYIRKFEGDYLHSFKVLVSRMLAINPPPPIEERIEAIQVMTDSYVEQTGEIPEGVQLNLLANWILLDVLRDSHPDKVTRTEYPIMNKGQLKTRHNREKSDEFIEGRSYGTRGIAKKKFTSEINKV